MTKRPTDARARRALAVLALALLATGAAAAPCAADDFETHVSGVSECLLMRRYGTTEPTTLLIWLHGDVSSGGPADYHFPLAKQAADHFASRDVMSVALVRPGYPDGSGVSSSVAVLQGGRNDHYTKENVAEVGGAIERLRMKYKPARVIVIGHSGGAATAALLLGMRPQLVQAAVLVSCPCELVAWRDGRRAWGRSENPTHWTESVNPAVKVIALTGTRDDNTVPELAQTYVRALQARGIDATFQAVPEATHNSALRAPEVSTAIGALLAP